MTGSPALLVRTAWRDNLLVGLGFTVLGVVGMLSAAPGHNEAPLWPAAGVAVAAVWMRGARIVPGLLAGAFLASWLTPGVRSACHGDGFVPSALGPLGSLVAACGNVAAALAAGRLLRSSRRIVRLDGVGGMLRLWLACLVYAVISGVVGGGAVVAITTAPFAAWPMIAMTWGSGDLVGALLVAPLIRLMALGVPRPCGRGEAMAIGAILAMATALALGQPEGAGHIPLSFLVFPPLLWAALRMPPLWSALAVAAVAATAFATAVAGLGPFSGFANRVHDLLGLQAYIACTAMAVHLLAVVTAEKARAMADLRASEERFRLLGESSGDLVCLHRLDGQVTWASPSVADLLGRQPEALAADLPWGLIHPDDRRRVRVGFRPRRLADGRQHRVRFRAQHADGRWLWLEASASLVRSVDSVPVAIQTASRDITAQVGREAELAKAREAAEAGARVKATFLAAMSHEIRTPLNGVIGMADLLAGEELPPGAREAAEIIRRSGETLLTLLNDILDFSKLEAGRLGLEHLALDPGTVATEVRALFARAATDKGLVLAIASDPDAPRVLLGDPARLRQVLSNLVSNAVKFTRRGTVTLRIGRAAATAAAPHGRLLLAVADTGIGIPAVAMDRLFREFSQVDAGTARRHGGTGLGLAISRRLVEAMGGTISVTSAPGQGSVFTVLLPLPDPTTAPAVTRPSPDEPPVVRPGLRVLLAEDDPVNQVVALSLLRRLGTEAVVAGDGAAALLIWEGGGIDLVLMDMQMPGVDGMEAARAIRTREWGRDHAATPIVALTANAFPEDRAICLAAGMDDILAKPVTLAALAGVLARFDHRHG